MKIREYLSQAIASDFIRKVAETFAARIVIIAIGLFTTVIVARILGPEGRGLYAVAAAIGAIGVQFSNLGLHASNTYYVAQDRSRLPTLLGNSLLVSFGFGSLGVTIAWSVFTLWPNLAPVNGVLLIMALLWIPIGLAYLLVQNLLIGIHEIRAYNLIEVVTKILGVSLIAIVIIVDAVSVENIFLMGLVALIISFSWGLGKLKPHLKYFPKLSIHLFKDNIRYGFKAYLAAFFAFMVLRVDLLMVQYMLGAEQAGYYSIAATMADMVYMFPVVIGTILFPKLSALTDSEKKWQVTRQISSMVGVIMIIITIISVYLAVPFVNILFGKAFTPAVLAFVWLMPGILLLSVNTVFMNYFASIGMPIITVYSPGAAVMLNIGLNFYLIPNQGIVGAALASVISYGLMLILSIIYLRWIKKGIRYANVAGI
ncbi:hypothetical protein PN36_02770 [Candidatus Thiomargarita nelsonii]|uniref:Uncharacterized protein n=1 Tax=Candidatus Thiomargarita nelsonii TaxID=1003181 RepID=A0A0A6PBE2_9GAMM|nr:hypothetical protein PN36_02770 [Candidatus Thiomargarita nelsonii]